MQRRMQIRVACVLGSLWVYASAAAQPTAAAMNEAVETARRHMEQGQALYLQSRFTEAAAEFMLAYGAQPFSAFLYNAGVAYERQGDPARAIEYFTRYLNEDRTATDAEEVRARIARLRLSAASPATLPPTPPVAPPVPGVPATASPPAVAEEQVRDEMKSLLSIRTNPAGAQITVKRDGRIVATSPSPFMQTLARGEYDIFVEHPDYRTVEEHVRVRPGRVYVVIVEMSQGQFLGYLRALSDIPGAEVYLDRREAGPVGRTPYANAVPTGSHHIWIEKPGYRVEERDVDVEIGEDLELTVALERVDYSRLTVISNVRGAEVYVDGRFAGRVPLDIRVPSGVRQLSVEASGMKTWSGSAELLAGQLTPVRVILKPAASRGAAWATSIIGAVLLGGSVTAGAMASRLEDELSGEADAGRLTSNDPRLERGWWLAVGADVGFGLAGVLAGVATYQFLRDPNPDSAATVLEPRDWTRAAPVARRQDAWTF